MHAPSAFNHPHKKVAHHDACQHHDVATFTIATRDRLLLLLFLLIIVIIRHEPSIMQQQQQQQDQSPLSLLLMVVVVVVVVVVGMVVLLLLAGLLSIAGTGTATEPRIQLVSRVTALSQGSTSPSGRMQTTSRLGKCSASSTRSWSPSPQTLAALALEEFET